MNLKEMSEDQIVTDFMEKERKSFSGFFNMFKKQHRLFRTYEIAYDRIKVNTQRRTIIRPSVFKRIFAVVFILFGVLFMIMYVSVLIAAPLIAKLAVTLLIAFVVFFVFLVVYFFFIDKKRNFKIIIGKDGLSASDKKFNWMDIRQTFILISPATYNYLHYLVIMNNENVFFKFNLENFAVTDEKLASIIELYKKQKD